MFLPTAHTENIHLVFGYLAKSKHQFAQTSQLMFLIGNSITMGICITYTLGNSHTKASYSCHLKEISRMH